MKKLLLVLLLIPTITIAQSKKEKRDVERRLTLLNNYLEIKIPKDTLNDWVESVSTGENTGIDNPDRVAAWQKFLFSFYDHLGTRPSGFISKSALANWANFMTSQIMRGRIFDLEKERPTTPDNELGDVHIEGSGNETLVLIPPLGFNWEVYESFIEHYKSSYQLVGITLPGNAGSPPYAFRKKRAPSAGIWLNLAINNIIQELESRGIDDFYLVTMGTGNFIGMNLAKKASDQVKGIVNINGAFASWLPALDNKENRASKDYREKFYAASFPSELLIELTPNVFNNFMDFTKDRSRQQSYMSQLTVGQIPNILHYLNEYNAQDFYEQLDGFNTPMLNLLSIYDNASTKAASKGSHRFWQEAEVDHPHLNSTTIFIPDARDAAYLDQPDLFYYYLDAFLGQPSDEINQVTGSIAPTTLAKPSPSAGLRETFGAIEVELNYHRPSVKGRTIFGELVPYGEVWRAGANEATNISFSNDVEINGQVLPKGTYGLFMVPEKDKWQIIFNKINQQWGAFNYRSRYDQIRIEVEPKHVSSTELLTYTFENSTPESIDVSLAWADTKVTFKVREAFELPAPPERVVNFAWNEILKDGSGDGMNPGLSDGEALSYYVDSSEDMMWFKFDLHGKLNPNAFAMNILIDTDADQKTGMNWFGTNTDFTFEKCLTLWMRREGKTFGGINGITDQSGIYASEWNRLKKDNLIYYLDSKNDTYTVGVSLSDLALTSGKVNIIGAVGEYMTWNDDIGDKEFATIELKK